MTAPLPDWMACDTCCRVHRGPKCKPGDQLSQQTCITFPGPTYRLLCQVVPKGERSGWVARLVARELEGRST